MSTNHVPEHGEEILEVDREEFALRLGVIAKSDGVGRMPVTLRFDGQDLVLAYGCMIRVKAAGNWSAEAQLSKAALKKFIKDYKGSQLVDAAGQSRASVKRFVRGLGGRAAALQLVRRDNTTLLIDGYAVPCKWSGSTDDSKS